MIVTEITTVLVSFSFGLLSGALASVVNVIGRGSRAARAASDLFIPLVLAGAYYCALFLAANGEFRLYSLISFAGGASLSAKLCIRVYPAVKRSLRRLLRPVISVAISLDKIISDRLSAFGAKVKNKRAKRAGSKPIDRKDEMSYNT